MAAARRDAVEARPDPGRGEPAVLRRRAPGRAAAAALPRLRHVHVADGRDRHAAAAPLRRLLLRRPRVGARHGSRHALQLRAHAPGVRPGLRGRGPVQHRRRRARRGRAHDDERRRAARTRSCGSGCRSRSPSSRSPRKSPSPSSGGRRDRHGKPPTRRSSATWAAARSCTATSLPSRRRAATGSWRTSCARRAPVYFNTFAQGYWVFTRHDAVRDIYKTPELFSSESITPWQPEPIYRFVPTQIDAPDHIKYRRIVNPWFSPRAMDAAEPAMRALCRRLVEEVAPTGGCDFVTEFAPALPHRGVPQRERHRPLRRRPVRPLGRGLLQRLRRRPRRPGGDGEGARRDPRVLGRRAGRAPRASRSRARATSPRTCSTPPSTTARSPTPRCSTC